MKHSKEQVEEMRRFLNESAGIGIYPLLRPHEWDTIAKAVLSKIDAAVEAERERGDMAEKEALEQARLLGISGTKEAKLITELEDWRKEARKHMEAGALLEKALADERERVNWFWKSLRRYGYHDNNCDFVKTSGLMSPKKCSCGLDEALEKYGRK